MPVKFPGDGGRWSETGQPPPLRPRWSVGDGLVPTPQAFLWARPHTSKFHPRTYVCGGIIGRVSRAHSLVRTRHVLGILWGT